LPLSPVPPPLAPHAATHITKEELATEQKTNRPTEQQSKISIN